MRAPSLAVVVTDRIAVGQSLLHDPTFHIGRFMTRLAVWTFVIELLGAVLLFAQAPNKFSPFSALFHAVSAFCNAGFSLFANSLVGWKGDWRINIVFMILIFLGGIGFSVVVELQVFCAHLIKPVQNNLGNKLSWHSKTVLKTSILLIVLGWVTIYVAEFVGYSRIMTAGDAVLASLFQSVTCRTAGFNTLDIEKMTNVSLVIMLFLMFIGGAPGSCAGGIKVTTFRVLLSVIISQLRGKSQASIGQYGISDEFVQDNLSYSVQNTLRGLHYQHPRSQAKLVQVILGEVFDVIVDIRISSPTFGRWTSIILSEENKNIV